MKQLHHPNLVKLYAVCTQEQPILIVTELMGNEIVVYMETPDEKQFVARVDPRVRTASGDDMQLAVNMANAHIFDPKTEMNLVNA